MNLKDIAFAALGIGAVLSMLPSSKTEKFTEIFGMAGVEPTTKLKSMSKFPIDPSKFKKVTKYEVTPDTVSQIVNVTADYIYKTHKLRVQPIETSYIHKYTSESHTMYKGHFMFLNTRGFPYAFAVSVSVLMDAGPVLVELQLQDGGDGGQVAPFIAETDDNFQTYTTIVDANVPR